jgi:hypothetical protein
MQAVMTAEREPGEHLPKGAIDPDLVKLSRSRAKVGIITAAGVLIICVYFLFRLSPDRRFGGEPEQPTAVAVSDILDDRIAPDSYIELEAEPLMSHAIRSIKAKGDAGLRVVPVRGSSDRLWLAVSGDGWDQPAITSKYVGRLRRLDSMTLGTSVKSYVSETPRPVFASVPSIRAGLASGKIKLVTGEELAVDDAQQVAFETIEPTTSLVVVSFNERLPDMRAWGGALKRANLDYKPATQKDNDAALGQGRFEVPVATEEAVKKLEAAELWAARVEPVVRQRTGTWGELKKSGADGLSLGGAVAPDNRVDLVGIFVTRGIPDGAYTLVTGEVPQDYWYVLPITIALAGIALLFAWALVRAIRRDLLPTRAPA